MCGCNRALLRNAAVAAARSGGGGGGGGGIRTNVRAAPAPPSIPTFDTSLWGQQTWTALHIASVFAPHNLALWNNLLAALQNDLPCPDCRAHYSQWLRNHPFRAAVGLPIRRMFGQRPKQTTILSWLLNLHNDVNSRLERAAWNEQQVIERFGGDREQRLAEGRAALESVRGMLGGGAFAILMELLG